MTFFLEINRLGVNSHLLGSYKHNGTNFKFKKCFLEVPLEPWFSLLWRIWPKFFLPQICLHGCWTLCPCDDLMISEGFIALKYTSYEKKPKNYTFSVVFTKYSFWVVFGFFSKLVYFRVINPSDIIKSSQGHSIRHPWRHICDKIFLAQISHKRENLCSRGTSKTHSLNIKLMTLCLYDPNKWEFTPSLLIFKKKVILTRPAYYKSIPANCCGES